MVMYTVIPPALGLHLKRRTQLYRTCVPGGPVSSRLAQSKFDYSGSDLLKRAAPEESLNVLTKVCIYNASRRDSSKLRKALLPG